MSGSVWLIHRGKSGLRLGLHLDRERRSGVWCQSLRTLRMHWEHSKVRRWSELKPLDGVAQVLRCALPGDAPGGFPPAQGTGLAPSLRSAESRELCVSLRARAEAHRATPAASLGEKPMHTGRCRTCEKGRLRIAAALLVARGLGQRCRL
jgi:hypothetical protein